MPAWFSAVKGHPSAVLLAAQLVAVLVYPFAGDTAWGRTVIGVFGVIVLSLAVYAVRATPALTWVAVVLGIPLTLLTVVEGVVRGNDQVTLWSAGLHVVFYGYTAYGLIRYLFEDSWVTRDEIFAVGANFTVVSWLFAYAFTAVQVLWPGSFIAYQGGGHRTFLELLYLSFANLTSVGLSDVTAVLPHARAVVIVEQVTGVMYVALIIARVVGLTITRWRG
ncbi:ion channel [Pedococcus sp. 5OH_020]|uniref:ion channel n=1 Tax=Pedococcus sp. 5OH_020 TaxID=2989814 RepID=UPI0022E9B477|nr:ion channel [Pedococcus sp. 5OH_020]